MGGPTYSQSTPSVQPPSTAGQSVDGGSRNRAQDRVGNSAVQSQTTGAGDGATCDPNEVHLPSPVSPDGDLSFYRTRHNDFANRYQGCAGLKPPTYYLGYGEKYVSRFTNETSPRLTKEGQAWLVRARKNLQTAIENRRAADPADFDRLEKNDPAFTSFAYGTHADAYWNAGLGDLNLFDLANIGLTPDMRDLLAFDGLTQVADIGTRLLGTWGERAIDYVAGEGTTQELVDAAYEGFQVVGDGIDEVFGEGTAQKLVDGAKELGHDAVDMAHGAYDVAADVVGAGVGAVDYFMGDGWTESTLDSGREALSDGADWVEDKYNSAKDWASELWDDIF